VLTGIDHRVNLGCKNLALISTLMRATRLWRSPCHPPRPFSLGEATPQRLLRAGRRPSTPCGRTSTIFRSTASRRSRSSASS